MKIAFFVRSMVNGGAEKVAAQLTRIWARLGHETVLLTELPTSGGGEYDCSYVAREFVGGEATIVPQRLRELHEKCHFDVVVFNGAINHEWFCDTFCAARALGLRTIIIIHHTANNWMYGCCNTKELFMDDVLSKADAMVCVDRMWALWWKYRGVKSIFIQNPVSVGGMRDERGEMRASLSLVNNVEEAVEKLKGKRNIVWVGRLGDALKRPELAIEVFAKLVASGQLLVASGAKVVSGQSLVDSDNSDQRPTTNDQPLTTSHYKMVMLGTCDKATKKRLLSLRPLRSLRQKSGVASIESPGFVTNVGDYLAKADAHLFTSATEVTVPQVVLEAMAAGVETVAFDQPVLREEASGEKVVSGQSLVVSERWRKVLEGEEVECDFDTPEVRQCLMDELHRSQQWFATHHLPELMTWRRWKTRMSIRYLWGRLMKKVVVSC